ncbi:MAG TPA: SRPBCC family protein, partial [Streptosporangiaceae bacterium]
MTTKSLLLTEFGGSVSADVDAPADDVFALLTETGRLPEWNTRIRRVLEPAPPPLAPGAEWVVQMQVAGARWPSRSTAVTHDPGRHLFEHTSRSDDGNPARALWRWQVTPIPGQRSRIEVSWHVSPRTSGGARCSASYVAGRWATRCRTPCAPSPPCWPQRKGSLSWPDGRAASDGRGPSGH